MNCNASMWQAHWNSRKRTFKSPWQEMGDGVMPLEMRGRLVEGGVERMWGRLRHPASGNSGRAPRGRRKRPPPSATPPPLSGVVFL